MAVAYPFSTPDRVLGLVGRLGLDLRLDDAPDADAELDSVIDEATTDVQFYLATRYADVDIAGNEWANWHATWFAVHHLCLRRLNDTPKSVQEEIKRRSEQLELVRQGKAAAPGLANARRPVVVTGYTVRLRDVNNQIRVDKSRSTGVAKDYNRVVDDTAPDAR